MDAKEEGSDECEEEMSVRMGRAQYASVCSTRLVLSDWPDLSFEAISSLLSSLAPYFISHASRDLNPKPDTRPNNHLNSILQCSHP